MELSLIDALGARAKQTDFGYWPDRPIAEAVMLKAGE